MTCFSRFSLMGLLAAGLMTSYSQATTVTTTSFNGWKATLTGSPTELDFSKIGLNSYSTAAGITLSAIGNSSIQFVTTGPDNGSYSLNGYSNNGVTSLAGAQDGVGSINIAMPGSGENAILFGVASTPSAPVTLTLSDGEVFTVTSTIFGLSISHPITWASLSTASGSRPLLEDFWFGTSSEPQDSNTQSNQGVSATPEGATLLLVLGGSLLLFGARRKVVQGGIAS
ncbi:MAG: hypothetical protein JO061_15560 [Acidobacteriaceae bacterium]|nr:hypothetical protein [Acidobacteriaceae bacterium]